MAWALRLRAAATPSRCEVIIGPDLEWKAPAPCSRRPYYGHLAGMGGVSHERAGTAGFELGSAVHGIVGFAIRSRVVWGVGFYY